MQSNTKRFTENSHRLKTQGNKIQCDQCDFKASAAGSLKRHRASPHDGKNRIVISVFIVQTLKYRVSVNEEERDLYKIMNYRFELYLYFVITPKQQQNKVSSI